MKDYQIDLGNLHRELYHAMNAKDSAEIRRIKSEIADIERLIIKPTNTMEKEPFFDTELLFKIALITTVFTLLFLIASL